MNLISCAPFHALKRQRNPLVALAPLAWVFLSCTSPQKTSIRTSKAATENSPVLAEAKRIFETQKTGQYSHKTQVDEEEGHYEMDCSGYVGYILNNVVPAAFKDVKDLAALNAGKPVSRPLAKHFVWAFDAVEARKPYHLDSFKDAHNLHPGDMIAWLMPAGSTSKDTGHIMIVREEPVWKGLDVFVPVYDSTGHPHGPDDTRAKDSSTGVGVGTVVLVVNAQGEPVGYRWGTGPKSPFLSTHIAFGRAR